MSNIYFFLFTESAHWALQSLSCDVRESDVCVSVCAIAEILLLGGLETSGGRAYR